MKYYLKNSQVIFIFLIGIALSSFVWTKACITSFTHDESFSYLHYCSQSFMEIISFKGWFTNNHILNSLFMKYSELLFGNSEFALRLPNLLALLVYMFYGYRLFKNSKIIFTVMIFLLLCTNNLLMDLFGLARGYGLSCGFMLMSLYHFIAFMKENKKTDLILFHFGSLLASLSNFTLLTFYAALLMIYIIVKYIQTRQTTEKFNLIKSTSIHFIPLLISGIVLYEPVRRVITKSNLGFGGKNGFYQDTVTSLISNTFHNGNIPATGMVILKVVFSMIVLISLFIILKNLAENRTDFISKYTGFIVTTFLMVVIPLLIVALHYAAGSDYPIARFSIFLFPLLLIQFGFLMQYCSLNGYQNSTLILISCAALISLTDFYKKSNFHTCAEWTEDSDTKSMIRDLEADRKINYADSKTVSLGINWFFEPTTNYYRVTKNLTWLLPVDREGIDKTDDYFYIFENELGLLDTYNYEIIKKYSDAKTVLIRNKDKTIK